MPTEASTGSTRLSLTWRAAAVALVAVVLVVYGRALLDPKTVLGDNYDFLRQFLPQRAFQVEALRTLSLPSWNPLDLMGVPYIASYQPAFFSPSTWPLAAGLALAGADVTPRILSAWQVLHLAFAGLGLLVCARLLRLSPWAGLAGGLTYALSGFLVVQSGHVNQQNTAAWLPWAAAAFLHLSRRPDGLRLGLAAGALAAVVLAGHPQIAGYGLAVLFAMTLWLVAAAVARSGRWRDGARVSLWLGLAVVAGLALAAVQILPLLQYGQVATRGATGYDYATTYSLPRTHLLLLVAPHALGSSLDGYAGQTLGLNEYFGYVGLLPLLLVPLALGHRARRPLAVAATVASGAGLLFALGRNGPLFPFLFATMGPVLERFRNPGRALVVVDLAMAMVVALAVDRLAREPLDKLRRAVLPSVALGAAGLLGLAVLWRLTTLDGTAPSRRGLTLASLLLIVAVAGLCALTFRRVPVGVFVAFVALDLGLSSAGMALTRPPAPPYKDAAAAAFVRNQDGIAPGQLPDFRVESDAGTLPLEQDDGAVVGVAKTMGDDSLVFAPYVELRQVLGFLNAQGVQLELFGTDALASPFLDLIGARYLFTERSPGLLPPAARAKYVPVQRVQGVWIYRNPSAFPLGWVVGGRVDPTTPASLQTVDLRAYAEADGAELAGLPLAGPGSAGSARVVGQGWTSITFEVDVRGDGAILATSLVDYPGWQLEVDGRPGHGLRVDHAFRGAWLPGGHHTVVWRFVNRPLRAGLAVSGVALALLTLLTALALTHRRPT